MDESGERDASHRTGNGGHGIGLAIARQIVESVDGRLTLSSRPGVGSTFMMWLPDRTSEAAGERSPDVPDDDPLGRR